MSRYVLYSAVIVLLNVAIGRAGDAEAIARGKRALESRAFMQSRWSFEAYDNAWKRWTPKLAAKPADYDKAFAAYYGLHPAPYPNEHYPMGLRRGMDGTGLVIDCMICHGGSLLGKSYIGLGNSTLDLHAFYEDMNAGSGRPAKLPLTLTNVRGTNEAFALSEYLLAMRNPDMTVREKRDHEKICDHLCEDVPPRGGC